jgi:hypothetical protein
MNVLAETMVSGEWITSFVVGVIGAASAALIAWKKGQAQGRGENITLKDPVPEVPVRKIYSPPTFAQHQDLERRVTCIERDAKEHREHMDAQLRDIRREQAEQFVKLMNAGEVRKDAIMDSMNNMVRAFHSRVDQLIDGRRLVNPNDSNKS